MAFVKVDKLKMKKLANIIFKSTHEDSEFNRIINMTQLLHSLGIEVYESRMAHMNISGYVAKSPDTGYPMIVVNADDHVVRQRFTLAHELGHLLLHYNWVPGTVLSGDRESMVAYRSDLEIYNEVQSIEEFEANAFAAELLMPEESFSESMKKGLDDVELSKYYGVSKPALNNRKRELKLRAQGIM